MTPLTPARGARGVITRIDDAVRSSALIEGRSTTVTALRGGPLSCGDRIRVVGHGLDGAVVEVRNRGASTPLIGRVPLPAPA